MTQMVVLQSFVIQDQQEAFRRSGSIVERETACQARPPTGAGAPPCLDTGQHVGGAGAESRCFTAAASRA